jgi:hypothetical protein
VLASVWARESASGRESGLVPALALVLALASARAARFPNLHRN